MSSMRINYDYPVALKQCDDGAVFARVIGLQGCATDGKDETEALEMAQDALCEWIAFTIENEGEIPEPEPANGRPTVSLDAALAAKAAIYQAVKRRHLRKVELATITGMDEKSIRRAMNPRKVTTLQTLSRILHGLGLRMIVAFHQENDAQGALPAE